MAEHHELRQLLRSNDKRNEGSAQTSCTQEFNTASVHTCVRARDMMLAHILDELGNM